MPVKNNREYRAMASVLAPVQENKLIESDYYVEGYATTVDSPYLLYEFDGYKVYEVIDRNAFVGADMSDVIMQFDHLGRVFARTKNGLVLVVDNKGLKTGADLGKTRSSKDLFEEINAGLITKMSWGFTVDKQSFEYDDVNMTVTRRVLAVKKIYDVSAVSIPANNQTSISARTESWSNEAVAEEVGAYIKRRADANKEHMKLIIEMEAMK
jgi:uncharacterized protein